MILERPKFYAQIRFDKEDLDTLFSGLKTDSNYKTKRLISANNKIVTGFEVSGIGLNQATVAMTGATFIIPQSTSDYSWFSAEVGASDIVITDSELTDNIRNYVELSLITSTGTPLTKAIWDPSANNGEGSEFNQQVDTVEYIEVQVDVRAGGFSGDPDKIPLCYIDVDVAGAITVIIDKRDMLFRLGTASDPTNTFSWITQQEPILSVILSGGAGTYQAGEIVTFASGATATVVTGGDFNITIKLINNDSLASGDALVGSDSGANRTVETVAHSFVGADLSITNYKDMFDALMSEIKVLKGTDFWYQSIGASISGAIKFINSIITQNSVAAKFGWTAGNLNITDNNGAPADADVVGLLRLFGSSQVLELTRQDGTGGSSQIAIADGEVMYITLPATGNATYTGIGAGALNYKVAAFASFVVNDFNYWLAFREGNKLFVRGLGELEIGEEIEIGDQVSVETLSYIGASDEADADPAYSSAKVVTQGNDLTTAIGDLDAEVSDYRFKTIANSAGADKTVRIYPSKETDAEGKTIYTFIDPTFSSKFPRTGYSIGTYDGGANNDQLVTLTFSDPAVGIVTVTATGPTFGAQVVGTFTSVGGGSNFKTIGIFANIDDTLSLVEGSDYATQELASADDAIPVGASTQFKICTIIHEVDAGNTTTQVIANSDIIDRRDFENVTSAGSVGTLFEATSADKTLATGDNIATVSFVTGTTSRALNLPAANANGDRIIRVRKSDLSGGCVIITPNGADTIDSLAMWVLCHQGDYVSFMSDGASNWVIIDSGLRQDYSVNNFVLEPTTNTSFASSDAVNPFGFFFDDLKPRYGKQRYIFAGLVAIEKGDNFPQYDDDGKQGYHPINAEDGKPIMWIAYYGSWSVTNTGTYGFRIQSEAIGNYIIWSEVYNKCNIIGSSRTTGGVVSIYTDGFTADDPTTGTDTTNDLDFSASEVLFGQSYNPNQVLNIETGVLTQGIHTNKLLCDDANPVIIYGIELINEPTASTQEITIPSGIMNIQGKEVSVAAKTGVDSLSYKGSISGTKGGFVGYYIDKNGEYQEENQEPENYSETGVADTTSGADTIGGLTDSSKFYKNSQGNLVRLKDATSADRIFTTVAGAPDANTITVVYDYTGSAGNDLLGSNLQFQDDGATPSTFAHEESITIELYAKIGVNADHSNEEPVQRRIGWDSKKNKIVSRDRWFHNRDYGNQGSTDFTSLSNSSDRAFTMDDGSHALVCEDCLISNGSLHNSGANDFYIATIFCSGLDLFVRKTNGTKDILPIFSDAPVGFHTIKMKDDGSNSEIYVDGVFVFEAANASNDYNYIFGFIPYLPKQPVLTENYHYHTYNYVLADFVATSLPTLNLATYNGAIDQGMIRKSNMREFVYIGTVEYSTVDSIRVSGRRIRSLVNNPGEQTLSIYGDTNWRHWNWMNNTTDTFDVLVDDVVVDNEVTAANVNLNGYLRSDLGSEGLHYRTGQKRGSVLNNDTMYFESMDFHCPVFNPRQWRCNPYPSYLIDGCGTIDNRKFSAYDEKPVQRVIEVLSNVSTTTNITTTPGILLAALGVDSGKWYLEGEISIRHDGVDSGTGLRGVIAKNDTLLKTFYNIVEFQDNTASLLPKVSDNIIKRAGISLSSFSSASNIYETQVVEGQVPRLTLTKISEDD